MKNIIVIVLIIVYIGKSALCCGHLAPTPKGHVAVASESAVILWDQQTQTESFIRGAELSTAESHIGFLVPTPNPPQLSAANSSLFKDLEDVIRPQVRIETIPISVPLIVMLAHELLKTGGNRLSTGSDGDDAVDVLSESRVGDYDATVLRASDAHALSQWIGRNGFVTRPAVEEWLQDYVRKGWTITAFKVAEPGSIRDSLVLTPVCMTFHTAQPFYPYGEPADMRQSLFPPARLLRLFVFSQERLDGQLGDGSTPWPGKTVWSNVWPRPSSNELAPHALAREDLTGIPSYMAPSTGWMTAFEDRSSPRPGIADVTFAPSTEGVVTPSPEIRYKYEYAPIPLEFFLIIGYILLRVSAGSRQTKPSGTDNGFELEEQVRAEMERYYEQNGRR